MIKTVIYGVCHNDDKTIEKWINSSKIADFKCLVDCNSTDETVSIIEKDPSIHLYKKDTDNNAEALNYLLNEIKPLLSPEDTWVFLHFNGNEWLNEDAIDIIKKEWSEDCDFLNISQMYKNEKYPIWSFKVHSNNNWRYVKPFNEIAYLDNKNFLDYQVKYCPNVVFYNQEKEINKTILNKYPLTDAEADWKEYTENLNNKDLSIKKEKISKMLDIILNKVDHPLFLRCDLLYNVLKQAVSCELENIETLYGKIFKFIKITIGKPLRSLYVELSDILFEKKKFKDALKYYQKALNLPIDESIRTIWGVSINPISTFYIENRIDKCRAKM